MNAQSNIIYLIHALSAVLTRQSDQVLQEQLGIGFSQFKILLVLEQSTGMQQKQIALQLGQTEASISRQVKLLLDNGLVTIQVSPSNRREHISRLTARGVQFTEKAAEILAKYQAPVFSDISEKQQIQLQQSITEVLEAAGGTVHLTKQ